jgi:acetylornithine/succinyldiaminopimelate/putrescine aminotransferase
VCATACSVFDTIADPAFLAAVEAKGERLRAGLRAATAGNAHVKEVCCGRGAQRRGVP